MSSSKFLDHQHKKKKHVYHERTSPFPVPISSITREKEDENYWYHYMGEIIGNQVHVHHTGDISYLWNMGFFGRGLMSRGPPTMYQDLPYVHIPTSSRDGDVDVIHVMRKKMYLRHMNWRNSLDGHDNEGTHVPVCDPSAQCDGEFDSDVEYDVHTDHNPANPESNNQRMSFYPSENYSANHNSALNMSTNQGTAINSLESNSANERNAFDSWESNSASQRTTIDSWESNSANQRTAIDSWESSSANQKAAIESWNTMEADEDFWNSDSISTECKGQVSRLENSDVICNNNSVNKMTDSDNESSSPPCKKIRIGKTDDNSSSQICDSAAQGNISEKVENCIKTGLEQKNLSSSLNDTLPVENTEQLSSLVKVTQDYGNENNSSENVQEQVHKEMCDNSGVLDNKTSGNNDTLTLNAEPNTSDSCFKGTASENHNTIRGKLDGNDVDSNQHEHLDSDSLPLPLHPFCCHDSSADISLNSVSDYIVIDDSDIDDNTELVEIKKTSRWLPVRKKEVFQFNEPLVLTFEEAFYLSYGLGCLTVIDEAGVKLTIADMWCRFNNKLFLPKYVTYHYFRSKGWVPKQSALFGTDMLVYKVGPTFYHATYSVIIKMVYEDTMEEVPGYNKRKLTWSDFSGLNRVTEHVSKILIFCYVIMPQDMSEEELSTPLCLSRFKVRLQQSNRWVSSQEREQGKHVDME